MSSHTSTARDEAKMAYFASSVDVAVGDEVMHVQFVHLGEAADFSTSFSHGKRAI